jgi:hypothetical protein
MILEPEALAPGVAFNLLRRLFLIWIPMSRPVVILCESTPRWAAAWRRCDDTSRLRSVPSLAGARDQLVAAPASVLAIDANHVASEALIEALAWSTRPFAIVLGDAALEVHRWTLMECGAALVVTNERQLPPACRAARRHLERWRAPELTFRERVWESLPWAE